MLHHAAPAANTGYGDESPKWTAAVAECLEDKSPFKQPYFGEAETPPKTVLPDNYDPKSGWTHTQTYEGWQCFVCVNSDRPGVPGHSFENAFCLATPTRDKAANGCVSNS